MKQIVPALALPLLLLVACAPALDPDLCPASDYADLVGLPQTSVEEIDYAGPMRIIYPDMAVTQDFVPERLNVSIDAFDEIDQIWCG